MGDPFAYAFQTNERHVLYRNGSGLIEDLIYNEVQKTGVDIGVNFLDPAVGNPFGTVFLGEQKHVVVRDGVGGISDYWWG